jgi:hypothetical protein
MAETSRLFWMLSPNFGDALAPWLVARLSGRPVVFVDRGLGVEKGVAVGSILNLADEWSRVWGAGVASLRDDVNPETTIYAVRGPLSREAALRSGARCPDVFGDPALLLPAFYHPLDFPSYRYEYGVVAHWKQQHLVNGALDGAAGEGVRVLNVLDPVEKFLEDLLQCRRVVSSALHPLVVAHAYGIPAAWVDWGDPIGGDGSKFLDHALAVDVVQKPTRLPRDAVSLAPEVLASLPYTLPDEEHLKTLRAGLVRSFYEAFSR